MSQQPNVKASFGKPVMPKLDENKRFWRELRCLGCRHWFGDEYIREGRIRLRCPVCDKITVMEFRPNRAEKGRSLGKALTKERNQTNE